MTYKILIFSIFIYLKSFRNNMTKKILTSKDPSEILPKNYFIELYNNIKLSIINIITPPEPGNVNNYNLPLSEPLLTKKDSMELLRNSY